MPGVNVNQITSTLAKLSSRQLQQYAAMHKDNPYVLALALSEANRRKDLQAAGQMQAANAQQPKVADAMIAQMALPEEQGIGTLPAGNIQMMADGGIAGYDEAQPVQMMANGGRTDMVDDGASLFERAMEAEGVRSPLERAFLQAIHGQESGGKASAKTSNRNAFGAMQILPSTFKSVADPGMDIRNPLDNMRAGIRYARQGLQAAKGDPVLAGAYYYGGPGGMKKLLRGVAVSDPVNKRAPTTLQYGESIAQRMQRILGQRIPRRTTAPVVAKQEQAPEGLQQLLAARAPSYAASTVALNSAAAQPEAAPRTYTEAPVDEESSPTYLTMMAGGGAVERYNGMEGSMTGEARNPLAFLNPGDLYDKVARVFREGIDPVAAEHRRQAKLRTLVTPPEETVGTPEFAAAQQALREQAAAEGRTLPSDISAAPAAPAEPAPTAPDGRDIRAPGLPSVGGMDLSSMYSSAMASARNIENPFATDIEALGREKVGAAKENLAGLEAIHKRFEDIFKGRRDRLSSREGEVEKLKDQSLGLALLRAGAAMMQTPGSVGKALGRGVEVGAAEYAAGMDKYQAARAKLMDAQDRLDELEAQRGEMSARELHKARNDIRATAISAREDMIRSNMDMYKLNREDAQKMFTAQVQYGIAQMEQSGANARAQLAANTQRLPAEAQMAIMLGKGSTDEARLRSGLAEMAKFKGKDGTTNVELLKQFVELKKMDPTLTPDRFLTDALQVMVPTYQKPGKDAVVRERP